MNKDYNNNGYNDYNNNNEYNIQDKEVSMKKPDNQNKPKPEKARQEKTDYNSSSHDAKYHSNFHNIQRSMVVAIVVLSMLLAGVSLIALNIYGDSVFFQNQLENQYQRSFFDLTDNMSNLEIKLSKLMVSNSKTQIQKNLNEVSRQTESTQINLSELPTSHETIFKTMRFVNQLGDYSNYLANTIADGGMLNDEIYATLESLYKVNRTLTQELSLMAERIGTEIKLINIRNTNGNGNGNPQINPLVQGFNNMQENSIDYPSMIYDGPFSDGYINAELKGLTGAEVTREQAEAKLNEHLKNSFSISEVIFESEANGRIQTYNFNVNMTTGQSMSVQMSKKGGIPVIIENKRSIDNFSFSVEECIEKAETFAKQLGYTNLTGVWASDYSGNVYVNLAPEINGIIYYPDLVKVIVARDNGDILGLESMSYLANHTVRNINAPTVTSMQARNKLSAKIKENVKSEKLTLIPQNRGETLAWEFAAEWNDLKYFVYIDAYTGEEVEVFRIIDNDYGTFII